MHMDTGVPENICTLDGASHKAGTISESEMVYWPGTSACKINLLEQNWYK